MAAVNNRYQLKITGTGSLKSAGSRIVRIPPSATTSSISNQVCHLFDVPTSSKLLVYEQEQPSDDIDNSEPLLISVTLEDIMAGVQQYYANGCDQSFLVTTKPSVLLDAKAEQHCSLTDSAAKSNSEVKSGAQRVVKPWVRMLDAEWPKHTPRCVQELYIVDYITCSYAVVA